MEEWLVENANDLKLPPVKNDETIFEYLVNEQGEWEHWYNRVRNTVELVYCYNLIFFTCDCFLLCLSLVYVQYRLRNINILETVFLNMLQFLYLT